MSLDQLINLFEESLDEIPEDFLNGETEFKKLKTWDSLGVLMVIDGVEMEFGVLLRKQDFDTITTLAELYEQIKQRRSA